MSSGLRSRLQSSTSRRTACGSGARVGASAAAAGWATGPSARHAQKRENCGNRDEHCQRCEKIHGKARGEVDTSGHLSLFEFTVVDAFMNSEQGKASDREEQERNPEYPLDTARWPYPWKHDRKTDKEEQQVHDGAAGVPEIEPRTGVRPAPARLDHESEESCRRQR